MYQEAVLQELIDSILRSTFVVGFLLLAAFLLQPKVERLGRVWANLTYGACWGLLAITTMAQPLAVMVSHTVDLRVVPLVFAAPTAGIPASLVAAGLTVAWELLFGIDHHPFGMGVIVLATLTGIAVAWSMGWRLGIGSTCATPLRFRHVLALAAGATFASALQETHFLRSHPHPDTNLYGALLLYALLLPGAVCVVGGLMIEFSSRRRVERAVMAELERTLTIAANIPGVLYRRVVAPNGGLKFRYVSERMRKVLGLDPEAVVADASIFLNAVHPDDRDRVAAAVARAAQREEEPITLEYRIIRPDGRTVWIQTSSQINPLASAQAGETIAEGVAIDITELKAAEATAEAAQQRLLWAAEHDTLTGLTSRQGLQRIGEEADVTLPAPVALLVTMDLRGNHLINELFGNAGGDLRLVETARRLRSAVPKGTVVARIGGDEFAVYTSDPTALAEPASFVDHVIEILEQPFRLAGQVVPLRMDVGYALRDPSLATWEQVLQASVAALEVARGKPDPSVVAYTPALKAERAAQHLLDIRLNDAIEAGEFRIFWQPVVAGTNRHRLGREALVRWMQRDGSCIMPDAFIPRAEVNGMWPKLDAYVLHRACREAAGWRDDTGWISVNMSPGWLLVGDIVGLVRAALDASGLPPERLCIEVTERALVNDVVRANQQITGLREMGVAVAIDDFGTGYSSLSYLSRLPISKIKIDKSFIDEIETSPRARDILKTVLELCPKLQVESIAEGVETEEQLAWLKANGCAGIQGYLIGRPAQIQPNVEIPCPAPDMQPLPAPPTMTPGLT